LEAHRKALLLARYVPHINKFRAQNVARIEFIVVNPNKVSR
jgi:hypothetical protein